MLRFFKRPLFLAWACLLAVVGTGLWWCHQEDPQLTTLIAHQTSVVALPAASSSLKVEGAVLSAQNPPEQAAVPATPPMATSPAVPTPVVEPAAPPTSSHAQAVPASLPAASAPASPAGPLPYQAYRRPFTPIENRPQITLVIMGLGPNRELTRRAIYELPAEVSLAFAPYTRDLPRLMEQAREAGHEVLLMLPLEPENLQGQDPGPYTLLATADKERNRERLNQILSQGKQFVGVVGFMGGRLVKSQPHMEDILRTLTEKGVVYIGGQLSLHDTTADAAQKTKALFVGVERSLDMETSDIPWESQIKDLEELAARQGTAVATSFIYPGVLAKLKSWSEHLSDRNLALAPLTARLSQPKLAEPKPAAAQKKE